MDYHSPMNAWHGKALYVDLSSGQIWTEDLSDHALVSHFGGRGLGVEIMKDYFKLDA